MDTYRQAEKAAIKRLIHHHLLVQYCVVAVLILSTLLKQERCRIP